MGEDRDLPRVADYPQMFDCFKPGMGKYNGPPIHLPMDPKVKQIFIKARVVSYAKREGVAKEIRRMVDEGLARPVNMSAWATQ